MKVIFITILICTGINSLAKSGKPVTELNYFPADTTVIPQILNLPLDSYIGKPVDSLLNMLPVGYTARGFMPVRIRYNLGVFQSYGDAGTNTVSVLIFIDHYQYMSFPNPQRASRWSMDLARQETISYIKVVKNNKVCMYGCNNPAYSQ